MRKLWHSFVEWYEIFAMARAAQILYNRGYVNEARELMAYKQTQERI
jgi:hypothetical protein